MLDQKPGEGKESGIASGFFLREDKQCREKASEGRSIHVATNGSP